MTAVGGASTRRCYLCDERSVEYEAHLTYDLTPIVGLCGECAALERRPEWDGVEWIRSMERKS